MNLLQQYSDRLQRETPAFFKKLRTIGKTLVAIGAALASPEVIQTPVTLPATIVTIGNYMLTAGVVIVAVASAACQQTPDHN